MRSYLTACFILLASAACAAPPVPVEPGATRPDVRTNNEETLALKTVPLEQVLQSGDYNNDRLPETPVPGAGTVEREIPRDTFLERLEQRKTNPDTKNPPHAAEGSD